MDDTAPPEHTPRVWQGAGEWLGVRGKTALITGAASGIGLATAEAFLALGSKVIGVDMAHRPAELVADEGALSWHQADVREIGQLQAVRDRMGDTRLDILIANAGIAIRKPILELTEDEQDRLVDVNFSGTMRTLRCFVPAMIAAGGGRVVVMSSASATHAMTLRGVYSATKAGLSGLVRAAALEWGPQEIAVNAVGPGIIRTALTERYIEAHPDRAVMARTNVPLQRMGTPQDIADSTVFLASPAAAFITGQTLMVDGGLTAGISWW